ncbi:MAG: ATP-dependent DNA helicase SCO5184 [uncultured Quadrisphaera sp.]|uniref:ATP-dependent DNA helicase SCO5184 n=1 Tax=uncultured Quadrisphaera sp. TaxID=904978 RepID=A0A6J4PRU5_9ACTN|nr:MAG: ATP-dependent DNA helicase SCO5184 [uncultured Quadrisphaera sp.]
MPVALPAHLSASRLVELAADPAAVALAVRRPVPTAPHPAARRGTAFHAWLEERFRADTLVDLDDVPGASDEDDAADERLEQLQAAFLASEWAERTPLAVEVDLETLVAGLVVRCRVDAVFPARSGPSGAVDVVDWKSGAPPTGERARHAAVQLAVYRLAWSRLHGVPLQHVGAAFFYAATGQTRRPADLLDEAGLEALVTGLPTAP